MRNCGLSPSSEFESVGRGFDSWCRHQNPGPLRDPCFVPTQKSPGKSSSRFNAALPKINRHRSGAAFPVTAGRLGFEWTRAIPGARPSGALRASKSAVLPICLVPAPVFPRVQGPGQHALILLRTSGFFSVNLAEKSAGCSATEVGRVG